MLRSLYSRMVAVLLGLLLFLGGIFVAVGLDSSRRYQQEVTQRLNMSLAEHLVAEDVLLVDGEVNRQALSQVFHTLMVINPNIEVYLLDAAGGVVAYSAPEGRVKRQRVSLEPIRAFLGRTGRLPILGDDPRSAEGSKVFSASPIMVADRHQGYLYVVLASEEHDSVAAMLRGSHILRLGLGLGGGALLVALLAGVGLFNVLTRRLRRLTVHVERFRRSDFSDPADAPPLTADPRQDEIGRLDSAFSQMARRIIIQMRQVRRTDQLRRELVANVSHDLRTPLASLRGYLETMLDRDDDLDRAQRHRFLETAHRHAERLGRLVDELFELARLESAEMKPKVDPFPIAELVQDVVQELRLTAAKRGVALDVHLAEDLPPVAADIGLIQRVLENLIENAIRHSEEGDSVTVVLARDGGSVAVRVEDTGCGIPQEQLPHVFDRFFQGNSANQGGPRPGGLGLAIVKRILELHGSAVEATSAVGRGTSFGFTLPAAA